MLDHETASAGMRMLMAATFDEVMELLDSVPPVRLPELADFLENMGPTESDARPYRVELGRFLADLCRSRPDKPGPVLSGQAPEDFPSLLVKAVQEPDLLSAFLVLRRHRRLLPPRPIQQARVLLETSGHPAPVHVLGALLPFDDHAAERVAVRQAWTRELRMRSAWERALFHASRAVAEQEAGGDSSSLVPAWMGLAAVLLDLDRRAVYAQVMERTLELCRSTTGVPPASTAQVHVAFASQLIGQEVRFRKALDHLDAARLLLGSLEYTDVLHLRARALEGVGAYGSAIGLYRRLLRNVNGPTQHGLRQELVYRLARCTAAQGRSEEALQLLQAEVETADAAAVTPLPQLRHEIAMQLVRRGRKDQRSPAAHMLTMSVMGSRRPVLWLGAGEAFVTLGDLARLDGCAAEAAAYYRQALVLATGDKGERPHLFRVTPRMVGQFPRDFVLPVLPAGFSSPRELWEKVLNDSAAQVRAAIADLPQSSGPVLRLRLMALTRLARFAETASERAASEDELLALYERAVTDDWWHAVSAHCLPIAEHLEASHGPAQAEAHLRDTLAAAECHGRGGDTLSIRLALARLLARLPAQRQEAFDMLWDCREQLIRQHRDDHDAHSWQEWAGRALPYYEELLGLLVGDEADGGLRLPDARDPVQLAFELHDEVKSRGLAEHLTPRGEPFGGCSPGRAVALVERHAPDEGMVLASYFVGERQSFVFVIASGEKRLRTYHLPIGRAELHEAAQAIRHTVDGDATVFPRKPSIRARRPAPLPLGRLAEVLLPFQEVMPGRALLSVAPHGPLAVLPLHALRLQNGSYCAEHMALVYAPSVSVLEHLLQHESAGRERVLCVSVASEEDVAAADPQGFEQMSLLPPGNGTVTHLTGTAATPRAVLDALGRHDLAYIVCHGHSGDGDPDDAALILSDGRSRTSKDTTAALPEALPFLLRARDMSTRPSTPGTVVLRACSAGWHDPAHHGQDFTGLTESLFLGGTRVVVAPIWQVNRDSSAELIDGALTALTAGEPMWKALWQAQLRLLADTEHPWLAHPYHWAAFIPLGDWR
ncbi:CHAT domain-containing protein [Streptomyces sp. ID05-47C]|uniref:CHAT domain-containing protein n=1 Tax=Streptomyces sp. ID05-47C TaxID=3028665 RepID=UPI0029B0199D|nr:CHAT domain-containing protein [Streptomyces sp. ID05-47C]MDX3569052.1 CHAT domain-containing protein [Streptomyces sp. ID05-47C]